MFLHSFLTGSFTAFGSIVAHFSYQCLCLSNIFPHFFAPAVHSVFSEVPFLIWAHLGLHFGELLALFGSQLAPSWLPVSSLFALVRASTWIFHAFGYNFISFLFYRVRSTSTVAGPQLCRVEDNVPYETIPY